ncbi:MAG TPA: hypothetical protein GXZ78_00215 [Eubacteriaceae bacterium]|jgi:uncharacterized membrane protein YczE|nr:hypothetical protein [Eubacteriaceae bacterium]
MKSKKNFYLKIAVLLFLGFFICALGMILMIYANLGADPWSTFQKGLSDTTGISIGKISQIVGLIIIIINISLKIVPGIATVLNMYFIGFFMDIIENTGIITIPSTFLVRIFFLLLGMLLFNGGIWIYLQNGLGAGPRDGLMLGLTKKLNLSITIIKTSIEVTVLVIGVLLGGPLGIGTVTAALGGGYLLDKIFQIAKFDSKNTYQRTFMDEWESIKKVLKKEKIQGKQQQL